MERASTANTLVPKVIYPTSGLDSSYTSDNARSPAIERSCPSTPASSVSLTAAATSAPCSKDHKEIDAISFFADLNNYLPLGCIIIYRNQDSNDNAHEESEGILEQIAKSPTPLAQHLVKLAEASLIRVSAQESDKFERTIVRIYLLPHDVGRRFVNRGSKALKLALEHVLSHVDISPSTWAGECNDDDDRAMLFDRWATGEDCSLFYMFNTLPSPAPSPDVITDRYSRSAAFDLLDPDACSGSLKTELYPYQRRAAAVMLQREACSELLLDPRLEPRMTPTGERYYYHAKDVEFYRNPNFFESLHGGILAETMGLGGSPGDPYSSNLLTVTRQDAHCACPSTGHQRPLPSRASSVFARQHARQAERWTLDRHGGFGSGKALDTLEALL